MPWHYQITSVCIVCTTIDSGADQRKHQSSTSLVFVRGIHQWLVNSLHKRPVTRKMFPFDDIIMITTYEFTWSWHLKIWMLLWQQSCVLATGLIFIKIDGSGMYWVIFLSAKSHLCFVFNTAVHIQYIQIHTNNIQGWVCCYVNCWDS